MEPAASADKPEPDVDQALPTSDRGEDLPCSEEGSAPRGEDLPCPEEDTAPRGEDMPRPVEGSTPCEEIESDLSSAAALDAPNAML